MVWGEPPWYLGSFWGEESQGLELGLPAGFSTRQEGCVVRACGGAEGRKGGSEARSQHAWGDSGFDAE